MSAEDHETRLTRVEGRLDGHEELCAERYRGIHTAIGELKTAQGQALKVLVGVVVALVGWMAVQLWNGSAARAPAPVQTEAAR